MKKISNKILAFIGVGPILGTILIIRFIQIATHDIEKNKDHEKNILTKNPPVIETQNKANISGTLKEINKMKENEDIKIKLENIYVPMFQAMYGSSLSQAKKDFNDTYKKIVKEAELEGTINLPLNYGDELLAKENSDEKIKKMLSKRRKEGVTDKDIKWWWNIHDLERRMMDNSDEIARMALFLDCLQKGISESKAAKKVWKFHVMYGDPNDTTHAEGDNRPLPYELKDRINIYLETRGETDPYKFKKEIENSSSVNSLIRKEIKAGNL